MQRNSLKFQLLRIGNFENEKEYKIDKPRRLQEREPKVCTKEPGIFIDCDMKYNSQLFQRAKPKTNAKAA